MGRSRRPLGRAVVGTIEIGLTSWVESWARARSSSDCVCVSIALADVVPSSGWRKRGGRRVAKRKLVTRLLEVQSPFCADTTWPLEDATNCGDDGIAAVHVSQTLAPSRILRFRVLCVAAFEGACDQASGRAREDAGDERRKQPDNRKRKPKSHQDRPEPGSRWAMDGDVTLSRWDGVHMSASPRQRFMAH